MRLVPASAGAPARGAALRRCGLAMALLSLTALAAGCSGSGSAGQAAGGRLTVAAVSGIDSAPLMVAVRDGLFSQHGVSVTVKQVPSTAAAYSALQDGTADVAAGDYAAFFAEISSGARLSLVADGYDAATGTMQVLTLPHSGITSPQDLVHKVVATPAAVTSYSPGTPFPYNIETLATESVLQSDGVSTTGITWRPMATSKMISALKDHLVNAILVTDPQIIQAETQLGAVEVLDSCSGVTANLPLSGYFSTAAFAGRHTAALRDFQAALATAQADAAQRSTVESVLRSEHMTAQEAAMVNIGEFPTFLNVGQVQRVADLMYDSGMIPSPVSVSSLLVK
jgi:NitT/TauT family transport system substrate-binding protein